jgi:hypothetical protein
VYSHYNIQQIRDSASQPTSGGLAEFFGEKGRIFGGATLFLMKNGRKTSDFVEQKKGCSTPDINITSSYDAQQLTLRRLTRWYMHSCSQFQLFELNPLREQGKIYKLNILEKQNVICC